MRLTKKKKKKKKNLWVSDSVFHLPGMVTSAWGMNEGVPGGIDDKGAPHPVGTFFALMGTLVGLAAIVLILFWRCKLL